MAKTESNLLRQVAEPILTKTERYAVNEVCRQVMTAWEKEQEPCDLVDLMTLLNQGAARAVKSVREFGWPPPEAA